MDEMDDMDDFLDEVESKFCRSEPPKVKAKKIPEQSTKGNPKQPVIPSTTSGDDLDALIDDIIGDDHDKIPKTSTTTRTAKRTKPTTATRGSDGLDNIINDIMADDGLGDILKDDPVTSSSKSPKQQQQSSGQKCIALYVNGPSGEFGLSTSTNKRACDRLHCTACDNRVVMFSDFRWKDGDCDYLHFRNNYPDLERLKGGMVRAKGHQAYCCQCSWLDVHELKELKTSFPSLKWICRKH